MCLKKLKNNWIIGSFLEKNENNKKFQRNNWVNIFKLIGKHNTSLLLSFKTN